MVKIAIIEKNKTDALKLKESIEEICEKTGENASFEFYGQATDFITDYSPDYDVAFIAVKMAHMDGFEIAKHLREIDELVDIIFVSDNEKGAIKGYESGALDYLIKPIGYETLAKAMERAFKNGRTIRKGRERALILKVGSQYKKYDLGNVLYVEVFNHELVFYFANKSVTVKGQLCDYESFLRENGFFRCFHSIMVRIGEINSVNATSLTLKNGKELPISRRRREEMIKAIKENKNTVLNNFDF